MSEFSKKCFVCELDINEKEKHYNKTLNLPVCSRCKDTFEEKNKETEVIKSLGEGFVCGCI